MKRLLPILALSMAVSTHASVNVTNYGAWPDNTLLTNINITMGGTNVSIVGQTFTGASNKVLEVFGGGAWCNVSNMTLLCWITNQLSATSVLVSLPAGTNMTGLTGYYGTLANAGFSNAIANAATPTDTIIIPTNSLGNSYLFVPTNAFISYKDGITHGSAVAVGRGGLTFQGQGAVVLQESGWVTNLNDNNAERGTIFNVNSTAPGSYPLIFTNLIFYGGEPGPLPGGANGANPSTGLGSDGSHHACWVQQFPPSQITNVIFSGCTFSGFFGEVLIGTDGSSNAFDTVINCLFYHNNASCLNLPYAHLYSNDLFENCETNVNGTQNPLEEFYRDYTMLPSEMTNCVATNCGVIALNGGYYFDPVYTITGNSFLNGCDDTLMETTPACDVIFTNNVSTGQNGIALGVAGYQDPTYLTGNSNIVVENNSFTGTGLFDNRYCLGVFGNGLNFSEDVTFAFNSITNLELTGNGYGWSTNVSILFNTLSNVFYDNNNSLSGQWFLDESNYNYSLSGGVTAGATNVLMYNSGWQFNIQAGSAAGATLAMSFNNALQMPPGAFMVISNFSSYAYPFYLNTNLSGGSATLLSDSFITMYWVNNYWTNTITPPPASTPLTLPWNL